MQTFRSADLTEAKLRGANLRGADLSNAKLPGAYLVGAKLIGANLCNTRLVGAKLGNACFIHVNLSGADLSSADLRDAYFNYADLRGANLSDSSGALFDSIDLSTANLHRTSYPWLTLRRQYSGPMVSLHVLALLLFFSPFIARGAMHLASTKMVRIAQTVAEDAVYQVTGTPTMDIAEKLSLETVPLWVVLLQLDRSPFLAILVLALVAYTALRIFLVWQIAPMKEEEERTGYTPPLGGYRGLLVPHRFAQFLFWVSMASTLLHVLNWLQVDVFVNQSAL